MHRNGSLCLFAHRNNFTQSTDVAGKSSAWAMREVLTVDRLKLFVGPQISCLGQMDAEPTI